MGSCFSVSLPCDQVVNQASQWLCLKGSHIHNLEKNINDLKKDMRDLVAKRNDVQRRVEREEDQARPHQRLDQVKVWLEDVEDIEKEYSDLISTSDTERERLCLCGFCSKNLKLSYLYGEMVSEMLRAVERLKSQGNFEAVTDEVTSIAKIVELSTETTIVGQEKMLETVWNRLMDDNIGIVGMYGMGGVGKTTLLRQINNKFLEIRDKVDIVIWVVVSQNATVHKIQGYIGKKLGLLGEEWNKKDENEREIDILRVLLKKKFVLLLDDIWEEWDLRKLGIPNQYRENGCKIAFTTRSQHVCGRMKVHDPIEVRCLDTEKAWDLFQQNVGESTLGSHPEIQKLAREVAGECHGLPLALTVIGKTMASRSTIEEWKWALDVLHSSASDFSEMENEILPILKYSYDTLKGEHVKLCFLYCSLCPEDSVCHKEDLIEYWIAEGFIDEKQGREKAINQGYEIIGTLVRGCLLLEETGLGNRSFVKMHDVVRDMALWIASDLGKDKERFIVKGGPGLREIPKVENWKNVRRMSLTKNDIGMISESHECPELTTLLLQQNRNLVGIAGEFFRCMPRLLVLDLSENKDLIGLPEEISGLVSLRYFNLSHTKIERIPVGVQKLKKLIHLNLESTDKLESLLGISNVSSLRTLKLKGSRVWLDKSLMKELQLLQHLECMSVSISSSLVGEQLLYDSRVGRCIQYMFIEECSEESTKVINLATLENLREVVIQDLKIEEIKIEKRAWNKSLTSPCFSNHFVVSIYNCDGLKDLTWLLFAPNLTNLRVGGSKRIEEIISKEKVAGMLEKETVTVLPFQSLKVLHLTDLPELKSIYWNALPFQCLKSLYLFECPKLRKLPLDSKSVGKVEDLLVGYMNQEWVERVEWVDESTRQRFLPRFKNQTFSYPYGFYPSGSNYISPIIFTESDPNACIIC